MGSAGPFRGRVPVGPWAPPTFPQPISNMALAPARALKGLLWAG